MTDEKYQEIKAAMKCTHCAFCNNKNSVCRNKKTHIFTYDPPCTGFKMSACAAWFWDIETLEDFNYFHERFRKEMQP